MIIREVWHAKLFQGPLTGIAGLETETPFLVYFDFVPFFSTNEHAYAFSYN